MVDPSDPSALVRRLSRRIETGKSIQLSPTELDLLVVSGAYEKLSKYVGDLLLQRSRGRLGMSEIDPDP